MSANNAIYVQLRLDDHWHVWMGFGNNCVNPMGNKHRTFRTKANAMEYAYEWLEEDPIVENGIVQLMEEGTCASWH